MTFAAGLAVLMLLPAGARAATLAPTPYMGWNTYYQVGGKFNESTIKSVASSLVRTGLAKAGYDIVWLDAGWASGARRANGQLMVGATRWPHGMKGLTGWLHSRGLRAGIYTDAGSGGCPGNRVGSRGHYQQDANTFAAWGFDAVKVDFCGGGREGMNPRQAYAKFANALRNNSSHRPMVLNVCNFWAPGMIDGTNPSYDNSSWGSYQWAPQIAQGWRTDTDIGFRGSIRFTNVLRNLDRDATHPEAAGPGHWNDPDYLGPGLGMTKAEAQAQFSMWAMVAAPLILGSDPRRLSPASISMLENPRVIAIDHDSFGAQGTVAQQSGPDQVWVKPLAGGDTAVALFNRGASDSTISTSASALGLRPAGGDYTLHDLWTNTTTTTSDQITADVPAHGVVLYRVTPQGATPPAGSGTYPTVTTQPPSMISATSAGLSGTVYPNGTDTLYSFQYGSDTSYGNNTAPVDAGSGTAAVAASGTLTGLTAGATYHYRLCAGHSAGSVGLVALACGADRRFLVADPPTAATAQASGISARGAVLNGTVDPNGAVTRYHFEYSTDPLLEHALFDAPTHDPSAGSGSSPQPESVVLRGLRPNTIYHFRLVASNTASPFNGAIESFHTLPPPPVLSRLYLRPATLRGSRFRVTVGRAKRASPKPAAAARISYTDSAAGRTTFTILKSVLGVRDGKRCVRATRKPGSRAHRCYVTVAVASFSRRDAIGRNSFRFTARVGGHWLAAGRYVLKAVARDRNGSSRPRTVSFRILG